MSLLHVVVALVAVQRAAELLLAARNTARLRAQGASELDAAGYRWMVALHMAWLCAIALAVRADAAPSWVLFGLYAALQPLRLWVIASLGTRWTTRLIVLPGAPLVTRGPYRWLRHPNYAIVVAEIALLPLAFGAAGLALLFTVANGALLARRIAAEERALAPYREASRARRPPGPEPPDAPAGTLAVAAARSRRPAVAAAVAPAAARKPR